ncbi:MAG: pyridoxamine 5'-phosphate oxidase family protein [Pseudomonadota bacterium]
MKTIDSIDALEALYDDAVPGALTKVATQLTPQYQRWLTQSRFVVLASVGPEGTDASPRGDRGAVAHIADARTLWLPDWRGNNRLDSLRNIVRDGRVSLMFMVPGCRNVVRVNGRAVLSDEPELTGHFEAGGKHPRTVIVIAIEEVYFQCAKALMRSGLWEAGDESAQVPSAGDFLQEVDAGFDGADYDAGYGEYAKDRMW